jgi:putative ABC transport system ATP-binding protein
MAALTTAKTMDGAHETTPGLATSLRVLLHDEGPELRAIVIYAVAGGLAALLAPLSVQALVSSVAFTGLAQPIAVLALVALFALGAGAWLAVLQARSIEAILARLMVRVAFGFGRRLPLLAGAARAEARSSVHKFFEHVTLQKSLSLLLSEGLSLALALPIGLLLLALYHPALLAFALALAVAMAAILALGWRAGSKSAEEESKAKHAVADWLAEVGRNPMTFRTPHGQRWAEARTAALSEAWLAARASHFRVLVRQLGASRWLHAVAAALLLLVGGRLVLGGQLGVGQLVAAELVVSGLIASFGKVGKHLEASYDLVASLAKLAHFEALPLERTPPEPTASQHVARDERLEHGGRAAGAASISRVGHRVELEQVTAPGLRTPVTLHLPPGSRTAIAAGNAEARRALVDLLDGAIEPTGGSVTIDGTPLVERPPVAVRETMEIVREVEVVDASLLENVRLGRGETTLEGVREALMLAGLGHLQRRLPRGLATPITPSGPLDDEEQVLLMFARAFVHEPRLLIVDAALDGLSDGARQVLLGTLLSPDAPWTLLVTTHRSDVVAMVGKTARLG